MDNIYPVLSYDTYEGSLGLTSTPIIESRYINYNWPGNSVSIVIPGRLPPQNFGLYTCRTAGATIQNYIIDSEFNGMQISVINQL